MKETSILGNILLSLRWAARLLALDSRRIESLALFIPAYFLAVLFMLPNISIYEAQPSFSSAANCTTIHNCARFFTPLVSDIARLLTDAAIRFFDSADPHQTEVVAQKLPHLRAFIIDYLKRLIFLSPLILLLCLTMRRVIYGLYFLFVFVLISTGWGTFQPFLKFDLLYFVKPEQFHPFWEFGRIQALMSHDLLAFGYLAALALILAFRNPTVFQLSALAAFGQAAYEHLGFITGVAAALHMCVITPGQWSMRLGVALRTLMACGVASVLVVLLILLNMYAMHGIVHLGHLKEGNQSDTFYEFFRFARDNIENYRYLLFRAAYFHFFPAALGLISGFAMGFVDPLNDEWHKRTIRAALAMTTVMVAFFLAAAIGFFTIITYSSEMAREFYSFVVILAAFFVYLGALGGTTVRLRLSTAPVPTDQK
jgi:hypothetical protein